MIILFNLSFLILFNILFAASNNFLSSNNIFYYNGIIILSFFLISFFIKDQFTRYKLNIFWLIKILFTFFLTTNIWSPFLIKNLNYLEMDSISYYFELINQSEYYSYNLISPGLFYLFKNILSLFEITPLLITFTNNIINLFSIVVFIFILEKILDPEKKFFIKGLASLVLIPDFIWFSCLLNKDTMISSLILMFVGFLLYIKNKQSYTISIIPILLLLAIYSIRENAIYLCLFLFIIIFLNIEKMKILNLFIFSFLSVALFYYLSGDNFNFIFDLELRKFKYYEYYFQQNSGISALLLTDNIILHTFFSIFKILNYLFGPIVSLKNEILSFEIYNFRFWQSLLLSFTSVYILYKLPNLILYINHIFKNKTYYYFEIKVFYVLFFLSLAISFSYFFIHERYRIAYLPYSYILFSMTSYDSNFKIIKNKFVKFYQISLFPIILIYTII